MMKKLIIVLVALLILPASGLAANDVTFPQETTISLSADSSTYTIETTSTFDSFTVNTDNIIFTVSGGSIVSLRSADRKYFEVSGQDTNYTTVRIACASSSTLSITVMAGAGSVALSDNSVAVTLPANSLSNNSSVSVTPQATYAQPSGGYTAVGNQVYNIAAVTTSGAKVTQLANDATLTFNYTDAQIANIDEKSLVVSYWSEETGEWINLPTNVNTAGNIVTATLNHFTKFIIQGKSSAVPAGSLIKTSGSTAVYYVGHDNKRYVFPDDKVYSSWYKDFKNIVTVTNAQMTGFALGGNITVRPGTKLIQFVAYDYSGKMVVDDPHVYAIQSGGIIGWVETAQVATALFGSNWEQKIVPVPNYLVNNYLTGTSLKSAAYPSGSVVKETSTNNVYYIFGGEKRLITANGRTSNRFQENNYLTATNLDAYPTIDSLTDYQNSISWTGGK